jgi:hypothetical protein
VRFECDSGACQGAIASFDRSEKPSKAIRIVHATNETGVISVRTLIAGLVFCAHALLGAHPLGAELSDFTITPVKKKGAQTEQVEQVKPINPDEVVIADFESGGLVNLLGGETGSWNLNPDDPKSTVDIAIVEGDQSGSEGHALRIRYSVDTETIAQNGYWTRLVNLDGSRYDHVEFDVRGDAGEGFTNVFKLEIKKYKDEARTEKIKGMALVENVRSDWQTVRIPLHKMTGIMDFSDPRVWTNPAIARKNLDEFVIVFENRRVT